MRKVVGSVIVNVSAGTADLILGLQKSNAAVVNFQKSLERAGEKGISEMRATATAGKLIEGSLLSSGRAMDAFLESTLHAGPLMQAVFPLLGGLAFVGVLTEAGKKIYEFYKSAEEAPEHIEKAFRGFTGALETTNAELAVTQARLQNDLALIEGRPVNNLRVALLESALAADKLGDSLEKNLKTLTETLDKQSVGVFKALFTGSASTGDISDRAEKLESDIGSLRLKWVEKINAAALAGDKQSEDAYRKGYQGALDARFRQEREALEQLRRDADEAGKPHLVTVHGRGVNAGEDYQVSQPGLNEDARLKLLEKYSAAVTDFRRSVSLQTNVGSLTEQKTIEGPIVEARKKQEEATKRLQAAVAELRAELAKAQEQQLSGYERLAVEEQAELQRLAEKRELNASTLPWVQKIYSTKTITAYMEALQAADKELREFQDDADRSVSAANSSYMSSLEDLDKAVGKVTAEYQKLTAEAAKAQAAHEVKMIGMAPGASSDPAGTARRQHAAEALAIEREYAGKIASETDIEKRNNLEAEKQLALQKAQYEMEEKIAAARKKSLQERLADMGRESKKATDLEFDAISNGIDGIADSLSKLMTGQKTDFAKMLQELGQNMMKESIRAMLQTGVAKLFGLDMGKNEKPDGSTSKPFTTKPQAGKPDGSTSAAALWVQIVGGDGNSTRPAAPTAPTAAQPGGVFSGAWPGGMIFSGLPSAEAAITAENVSSTITYNSVEGGVPPGRAPASGGGLGALMTLFSKPKTWDNPSVAAPGTTPSTWQGPKQDVSGAESEPTAPASGLLGLLRTLTGGGASPKLGSGGGIFSGPEGPGSLVMHALGGIGDESSTVGKSQLSGDGFFNSFLKTFLTSFGGFMAKGGDVAPGVPYIVGEAGRELFVPKQAGMIVRSQVLSPRAGAIQNTTIDGPLKPNPVMTFFAQMDRPSIVTGGDGAAAAPITTNHVSNFTRMLTLTPRAEGGSVTPGTAYLVGERGPEAFVSSQAGQILSTAVTQRGLSGGGHTFNYAIDARGTDPVLTEMRVRKAIVAAHSSAVSTSVQVQHDRLRRVPGAFSKS